MKRHILVTLTVFFFSEFSYPESRSFLLPAHTAIAVSESSVSPQVSYAERVGIVATESSDGSLTSPFRIVGYDMRGSVMLDRVFSENLDDEIGNHEALSFDSKNATILTNFLSVTGCGCHLTINHANGEYIARIIRIAPRGMKFAKSNGEAGYSKRVPVKWQRKDGDMQYYYSQESSRSNTLDRAACLSSTGNVVLVGAVYQSTTKYSIKFKICQTDDPINVIAEGEAFGGIEEGQLSDGTVAYKSGADKIKAEIILPNCDMSKIAIAPFERHSGIKHQTVCLIVGYGDVKLSLDMRVMVDWPEKD